MLRQLAPWVLIMIISTILSDVFGLCTQFFNFWYLSICVSLYTIIYTSSIWSKNGKRNEINLSYRDGYDFDYIMQYVIIFFAIMIVTFIISQILGIDFFVAHAFVYLGETLNYNPLEIQS